MAEEAMFTALPNGLDAGGRPRLSVFVTPRLTVTRGTDAALTRTAFPTFVDWPASMQSATFAIHVDGRAAAPTIVDPDAPALDSQLWTDLFTDVVVRSRAFSDHAERTLWSYPAHRVVEQTLALYTAHARQDRDDPIPVGALGDVLRMAGIAGFGDPVRVTPDDVEDAMLATAKGRYVDLEPDRDGPPLTPRLQAAAGVVGARRFYDRGGGDAYREVPDPSAVPPSPAADDLLARLDFHAVVGFLGGYPVLLRQLGLVRDLVVTGDVPAEGRLRVDIASRGGIGFDVAEAMRPWTHFRRDRRLFVPVPRGDKPIVADGMLALEGDPFSVTFLDPDGTAFKLGELADVAFRLSRTEGGLAAPAALPALRSAGLTILQRARARQLADHLVNASTNEDATRSATPVDLFADDVLRGYRIDVLDLSRPSPQWQSLCHRSPRYRIERAGQPSRPLAVDPDEGYVKATSVSSAPGNRDLYLHEAIAGWDGWSLVARRPGAAVGDPDRPVVAGEPERAGDVPLVVESHATPGTLPRLRYGRSYRLRARTVDLAGNSLPPESPDATHASAAIAFARFDPVPSPAIVPLEAFTPGEAVRRLVVRTLVGPAAQAFTRQVGEGTFPASATSERFLAAPKASQQLAELHGAFDGAMGRRTQRDRDAAFDVAVRETGTLMDPGLPGVAAVDPSGAATALPATKGGELQTPGAYVVHRTRRLTLPYLPDPVTQGIVLATPEVTKGRRRGRAVLERHAFEGSWPDLVPIRLRLERGAGPPTATPGSATDGPELRFRLSPASVLTLRLSSWPRAELLDTMAIWKLLGPNVPRALRSRAEGGHLGLLTPAETVVLVHAVEQPLEAPVVHVAHVDRQPGETFAALVGELVVHAQSTSRVDIEAAWSEPFDDPVLDGPTVDDPPDHPGRPGSGHVTELLIEPAESEVVLGRADDLTGGRRVRAARHEFGDTKHRRVAYRARATTRFREYFGRDVTDNQDWITRTSEPVTVDVPSSRRPDPPEVAYIVPTARWERGSDTGGLVHTRRSGGLRVYLRRPWWSSGDGEQLGVVLADQTPPPFEAPDIDLGRLGLAARDRQVAVRLAAALARATNRPAARAEATVADAIRSSGLPTAVVAERLRGAVAGATDPAVAERALSSALAALRPSLASAAASVARRSALDRFVTQWGVDPVWKGVAPDASPRIADFTNRAAFATGVVVPGAGPFGTAAVVRYDPRFDGEGDEARRLWYADVDIDLGVAYFPLVRLALARYQPDSLAGLELSTVVLGDFTPLLPDRTTRVTVGSGTAAVTVSGPGGTTKLAEFGFPPGGGTRERHHPITRSRVVEAWVERLPRGADPDLGWARTADPVRLRLTSDPGDLSDVRWSGDVALSTAAGRRRIVVHEYERLGTDVSLADDPFDTLFLALGFRPTGSPVAPTIQPTDTAQYGQQRRLVYAARVDLG